MRYQRHGVAEPYLEHPSCCVLVHDSWYSSVVRSIDLEIPALVVARAAITPTL